MILLLPIAEKLKNLEQRFAENMAAEDVICNVVAMDTSNFCYKACKICENVLPDDDSQSSCTKCSSNQTQHLFRIILSIATDTKMMPVMCFDRVAKVLFGCTADQFLEFANLHPSAVKDANEVLEGELIRVTLKEPTNKNAQHKRITHVVPLSSDFQPVFQILTQLYAAPPPPHP